MTSHIDKILDVLDVGLQTPIAPGYGTDMRPDQCARCRATAPVDGGELCEGCRAFLLGDTDDDPGVTAPRTATGPLSELYAGLQATVVRASEREARARFQSEREARARFQRVWTHLTIRPSSSRITDITES